MKLNREWEREEKRKQVTSDMLRLFARKRDKNSDGIGHNEE